MHREFIADKWELMMQQKADFGIQATRPATSAINPLPHDFAAGLAVVGIHPKRPSTHIDLVRYVSTPDTGSRRMALPDLDDSKVKWSSHLEEKSSALRRDEDTFGANMQDAPMRVVPSSQSVAENSPLHPTSSTSRYFLFRILNVVLIILLTICQCTLHAHEFTHDHFWTATVVSRLLPWNKAITLMEKES